jgi:hypothetical protein
MSISDEQELLLSQLIDNELPVEQANQTLYGALDELGHVILQSESCACLKNMLQLRLAMERWRDQQPERPMVALATSPIAEDSSRLGRRLASFATAAMLGGILVAGGFYLGSFFNGSRSGESVARRSDTASQQTKVSVDATVQSPVIVTPEQRHEIAKVFALHESVVGPLNWYASDDVTIQVAPAEQGEKLQQPVAVVLRMSPLQPSQQEKAKTYVIVCRNNDPSAIELPHTASAKTVRLRLLPKATDHGVSVQYAVMVDESGSESNESALAGRRKLDLGQTSLGQLALNDRLVNVDASAWVVQDAE